MSSKLVESLLKIKLLKTSYGNTQFSSKQQTEIIKKILINNFKENKNKLYFIEQPNGTQRFPDFILFNNINKKHINFELKRSNNNIIIWNDGFPKENTLYLFCGKENFVFTSDCFDYRNFQIYDNFCKQIKIINENYKDKNSFKFYCRKLISQKIESKDKEEYIKKSIILLDNFYN